MWQEYTALHFRKGGEILPPVMARYKADVLPATLAEAAGEDGSLETLRQIGDRLEEHIRHAVRVVLPLVEDSMLETALAARLDVGKAKPGDSRGQDRAGAGVASAYSGSRSK